MEAAAEAITKHGPATYVHFKFTCQHCGERCTLSEKNKLYENGECFACGKATPIKEGGFVLIWQSPNLVSDLETEKNGGASEDRNGE